jgi:flap endonuclease GEN
MGVKLVFVMEGEPPKLKADVMSKRNQMRYGPSGKTWSQKTGRSQFSSVLREASIQIQLIIFIWIEEFFYFNKACKLQHSLTVLGKECMF